MAVVEFPASGWRRIGPDDGIRAWANAALPIARASIAASAEVWRCGGTWFTGVDALPNDATGAVGGVALPEAVHAAVPFRPVAWHKAQVSTIRPGYPRPSDEESPAAFDYRLRRDAAHVDGLLPVGAPKRRMAKEPHGFILGLPLNEADRGAAPLVVWEGSQGVMRRAFAAAFAGHPAESWDEIDVTERYQTARREVFATCRRVELPALPGEALLLHRLVLHGMAPWDEAATASGGERMVAYFRPELGSVEDWLERD